MWYYQNCDFSSPNKCYITNCFFFCNRNPAPNWNPVPSPDVLDYIPITGNGLQGGQGLFKEHSEFLETLPLITRYTILDKDEL